MKNTSIKVRLSIMIATVVTLASSAVAVARITTDINTSIAGAEQRLRGNIQMIEMLLNDFDATLLNLPPYSTGEYFVALADASGNIVFSNKPNYENRTLMDLGMTTSISSLPIGIQFEYTSTVTDNRELALGGGQSV